MSVLENFFKVAAVIAIITFGMNVAIGYFGERMTGQTSMIVNDVNISNQMDYESTMRQSSTSPEDLPTDLLTSVFTAITNWVTKTINNSSFLIIGSPLSQIIYSILAPLGTEYANLAIGISLVILMFQFTGGFYLVMTAISIVRGGGQAP